LGFSPEYIDHFTNPRGVGEIESPDAVSEVKHKGGGCFDKVRLTLRIDDDKITSARFRARACSGTIAACSALVEKVEGHDLDMAKSLTSEDLVRHLGGIPEKKQHSVELAIEALAKALETRQRRIS